ncbi:MAG TPA: DUF1697 domain-containing protein [Baekduia sp.]|uniref:DUF1697 domain-containing protein n=1 Tax=Baekduia sp. TaxID=2600305 RepID=UPI002D7A1F8F|nr:DUF1697 domain-containing protein [Baekduia sp.]HET6506154.1 DUF1697 domain-containing protein [Baekduia sp.]
MPRQIALLRGVNVGPTTKVAMADLRGAFAELGFTDIKTYVNSGNVVFSGRKASLAKVERAIAGVCGWDVPVVLRTQDELADVLEANPLGDVADNASRHLVLFADAPIDAAKASDLDADALAPEAFAIRGREAYLWLPNGVQRSPLAKAMNEKRFGVRLTGRNFRTVDKLASL